MRTKIKIHSAGSSERKEAYVAPIVLQYVLRLPGRRSGVRLINIQRQYTALRVPEKQPQEEYFAADFQKGRLRCCTTPQDAHQACEYFNLVKHFLNTQAHTATTNDAISPFSRK